jgi:hypothetical protein
VLCSGSSSRGRGRGRGSGRGRGRASPPQRVATTRASLKAGGEPLATKMLNSGLFNPDDMLTKRDVQLKTEDQETALAVQMVDEQVGSRRPTRMPRLGCARTAQHARRRCVTSVCRFGVRRRRRRRRPRRGTVTWCRRRRRAQPQQKVRLCSTLMAPQLGGPGAA